MGSPASLQELRINVATSQSTAIANAAGDGWNIDNTQIKLRMVDYDDSGLEHPGIEDETIQERAHAKPVMIPGLRKGGLKFSTYLGSASATNAIPTEAKLVNIALGGHQSAMNARSTTCAASSTSTMIKFTSANTYAKIGQALLVGTKGDGRGNGEVKVVTSTNSTECNVTPACLAAPNSGDAIVVSDTVYYSADSTQLYLDTLSIGKGTADQRQCIGAAIGSLGISGLGIGELPKLEFDLQVSDHDWVNADDRATSSPGTAVSGGSPPFERAIGQIHIADNGSTTRTAIKGGDISVSPNIELEELPSPSGVNGLGGFRRMPSSPTFECSLLVDEDFGLVADWDAGTAKQVLFSFGHQAQRCCAIEFPKAYLDAAPVSAEINNLSAMKIVGHGQESYVASDELRSSPMRIHWF